jgi:hypothetical protein
VLRAQQILQGSRPRGLPADQAKGAVCGRKVVVSHLIRPDGHIGYRCGGTDLDGLQNYLTRWLPNTQGSGVL